MQKRDLEIVPAENKGKEDEFGVESKPSSFGDSSIIESSVSDSENSSGRGEFK